MRRLRGSIERLTILSGLGFGFFFVLLDRTSSDAGLWPLVSARAASVGMFAVAACVTRRALLPGRGSRLSAATAGLLDGAAAALFLAASRAGALSVVVVLASLYPAVTVVLARLVMKERLSRRQIGALCAAAIAVSVLVLGR
ncbi:MAG: EamA family transporter [Acidimicrobiales bacterium]